MAFAKMLFFSELTSISWAICVMIINKKFIFSRCMKSVHLILGYYSNYLDICMLQHYIALYKCLILILSEFVFAKILKK